MIKSDVFTALFVIIYFVNFKDKINGRILKILKGSVKKSNLSEGVQDE